MRLAFITNHQIGKDVSTGKFLAAGASGRLRAILPAQALSARGFDVSIISLHKSVRNSSRPIDDTFDIYIVSKLFDNQAVDQIEKLIKAGKSVIFDFCDNYFERSELNEFYVEHQRLLRLATYVTVNTNGMASLIRRLKPEVYLSVIPDCYESDIHSVRLPPREGVLRLLAFGNRLVCKHLSAWLPAISKFSARRPISLEVLTQVDTEILRWLDQERQALTGRVELSITNWTEYQLDNSFRRNDIVVIPSEDGPFYKTKSSNRLIESVVSGLPVIAYPVDSYLEFIDDIPLCKDPESSLELCLERQDLISRGLTRAREKIFLRYSYQSVGKIWEDTIKFVRSLTECKTLDCNSTEHTLSAKAIFECKSNASIVFIDELISSGLDNGYRRFTMDGLMRSLQLRARKELLILLDCTGDLETLPSEIHEALRHSDYDWWIGKPIRLEVTNRERMLSLGLGSIWTEFLGLLVQRQCLTNSEIEELDKCNVHLVNPFHTIGPVDRVLSVLSLVVSCANALKKCGTVEGLDNHSFDLIMKAVHEFVLLKHVRSQIGHRSFLFH